jgi:hypothetical protein
MKVSAESWPTILRTTQVYTPMSAQLSDRMLREPSGRAVTLPSASPMTSPWGSIHIWVGLGLPKVRAWHDDVGADHVHVSGGPEGYPGDVVGAEDLGVEQLGQVAFEAFLLDDVDGGVGGGDFGAAAGHASEAAAVDGQEVVDDEAGADLAQALRGDLGDHVALEALVLQEKGDENDAKECGERDPPR